MLTQAGVKRAFVGGYFQSHSGALVSNYDWRSVYSKYNINIYINIYKLLYSVCVHGNEGT